MPVASFSREIPVSSSIDECWRTITDVARVASWVSIAKEVHENERLKDYAVVLEDRLGPFRLRADLAVTVSDVREGRGLHVHAEGEDRQVASQIKVDADLRLEPGESGTLITVEGTYEVSGRVATLGAAMITSKAQKIMDEFFENAARELS